MKTGGDIALVVGVGNKGDGGNVEVSMNSYNFLTHTFQRISHETKDLGRSDH
jgi:hypothetical protein